MLGNVAYVWVAALAASSTFAQSTPTNGTNSTSSVPQVKLDQGTFNGIHNGSVDRFLGIHYAKPTSVHIRRFYCIDTDEVHRNAGGVTFVLGSPSLTTLTRENKTQLTSVSLAFNPTSASPFQIT